MPRHFASKTGNTWKLLTCFPCLKGNAQIKASLGLQTLTALPPDRMSQGTAPSSCCVQTKLADNRLLCRAAVGSAKHLDRNPEMHCPCSLWAARRILAWPGPVCDHWHTRLGELPAAYFNVILWWPYCCHCSSLLIYLAINSKYMYNYIHMRMCM